MATVEIKLHAAQFASLRRMLAAVPREIPKVMAGAINVTARAAKERAIDEIRGQINLKRKDLRDLLKLRKATRRVWSATIEIPGRRLGLIRFGAKQTQKGVSYKIKAGGRKQIRHAFVQTVNTAKNVWRRAAKRSGLLGRLKKGLKGRAADYQRNAQEASNLVGRLPIVRLRGPSLGQVVHDARAILKRTQEEAAANLEKNIDSKVAWILSKRAAG